MAETFDQAQYYAKQAERTSDSMPEADKRTLLGTVEGTVAKGSNLLRTLGGAIREKVATLDEAN